MQDQERHPKFIHNKMFLLSGVVSLLNWTRRMEKTALSAKSVPIYVIIRSQLAQGPHPSHEAYHRTHELVEILLLVMISLPASVNNFDVS